MRRFTILLLSAICLIFLPSYRLKDGPVDIGTGDELYSRLRNLKHFEAIPEQKLRAKFYFSSYSGDDTNPCTELKPCQTYEYAKDICLDAECIFAADEVWTRYVATMDQAYDFEVGDYVSWNNLADVGIVIGVDQATKTVAVRTVGGAGAALVAGDVLEHVDFGEPQSVDVDGITAADPGVVNMDGHPFNDGDIVYASGIVGMVQLNNRFFVVDDDAVNTFTLDDPNGTDVATDTYTVWSSGGTFQVLTDPADATAGSTVQGDVEAVTDTLGATGPGDDVDADCGADELCILYSGAGYGEHRPKIDCNDTELAGDASTVFKVNSTTTGIGAMQNFIIDHCEADGLANSNTTAGNFAGLNIDVTNVRSDVAAASYQGATSHGTGNFVCVNCNFEGRRWSDGASGGAPVAFTSTGNHTLIGDYMLWDDAGSTSSSIDVDLANAGKTSLVGYYLTATVNQPAGGAGVTKGISITSNSDYTLNTCRVSIGNNGVTGSSGIVIRNSYSSDATLNLYETTVGNVDRGLAFGISWTGTLALFARGIALYENSLCTICQFTNGMSTTWTVDIEGVYDDGRFYIDNAGNKTKAQIDATLAPDYVFFDTNSADPDGAHPPWENAAGTARPQLSIDPACGGALDPTECYDYDIGAYACPLAQPIYDFYIGRRISSLVLQGKIGAR